MTSEQIIEAWMTLTPEEKEEAKKLLFERLSSGGEGGTSVTCSDVQ
jgi:hypothetical protein